ncbi:hypothetical protein H4S03_000751 [Coemansia sp. S3946]|nr:hypothetical protein H4S03_000751 [Coemansia sp. S3946]
MTCLSLFQFLPVHIVRLIVQYIRVSSNHYNDRVKYQQLLWVCDNFRTVIYSLYSQRHYLKITGPKCKVCAIADTKLCPWVLCLSYNGHHSYDLVKELIIHVELECIYSGKALTLLSRAPYKDCVFPLVQRVSFTCDMIIMRKDRDIYASCAHDNIAAFVKRLRQMTPRAHEFDLTDYTRVRWPENTMGHFGSLANQILQYTSRFKNTLVDYRRPVVLNFDGICNLTHIDYELGLGGELCFQLARQCAPMLQSLRLCSSWCMYEKHFDLSGLIRDNDGVCVKYSHLQKLTLNLTCNSATLQRPVLGTFVAFPALRHLSIRNEYPFGDDTLFRGNAVTLEYLRMSMHASTATMLKERRVFTRSSHPMLRYVVTHGAYGYSTDRIATNVEYMRFVLSIGSKESARVVDSLSPNEDIPCLLQLLGEHKSIQILALNELHFSLLDIVSLIKSLPLLSDLRTGTPKLDSHLADTPRAQIVQTLSDSRISMGKNFRRWDMETSCQPMEVVVECVILLALICPSFDRADLRGVHLKDLVERLKGFIVKPPFSQHEQRLQRLLLWERQTIYPADKKCPLY